MIDRQTIDKILDAANIVEVVSEFVTLKRAGANYKGLCPFHNDRTPSFVVSPAKGLCKCFSCGKGGNVVHFIMEHEQLTYYESLKWLAKKYNIEVQEREMSDEEKKAQDKRESMFIVNEFARDYFQDLLYNSVDGRAIGMQYFRSRGFRDDTIKKFQLGYSSNQADAFLKAAKKGGYNEEYLIETGLCYKKEDGTLHDRFWGRVIFPIHTLSGKVVAFGGRVLDAATKGVKQKYVNSPESYIYEKRRELYGLFQAKQAIVREGCCYMVEGYTDVISMHQCGIENVVASSGTSLTTEQIRLIHRFTENLTILYDGDEAGIHASLRGIDMLLAEGINIKVLLLPDGDDPDSFARKHNSTEYKQYIEQHQTDFIKFKTNTLLKDAGTDPVKRAELIGSIVKSISVIPNEIVRDQYIHECSQALQVKERLLVEATAKAIGQTHQNSNATKSDEEKEEEKQQEGNIGKDLLKAAGNSMLYQKELNIMKIIIRYGEKSMIANGEDELSIIELVSTAMKADNLTFGTELHNIILAEGMEHVHDEGFVASRYYLAHPDSRISQLAAELASERYQLSKLYTRSQNKPSNDEDKAADIAQQLVVEYKYTIISEQAKQALENLHNPEIANDMERCLEEMKRYKQLTEVKNAMSKILGDRVVNI